MVQDFKQQKNEERLHPFIQADFQVTRMAKLITKNHDFIDDQFLVQG